MSPKKYLFQQNIYIKRNKKICKPLLQLDLSYELIRKWDSLTEVAETLKFNGACISETCNGKQKTYKGYKWGYVQDYERIPFRVFDLEIYRKKVV